MAQTTSQRKIGVENGKQEGGDVLNQALMGIRANAEAHRVARLSPKKIYGGVKSKVAGNIKSIKKSQTKSFVGKSTSAAKMDVSSSPFA